MGLAVHLCDDGFTLNPATTSTTKTPTRHPPHISEEGVLVIDKGVFALALSRTIRGTLLLLSLFIRTRLFCSAHSPYEGVFAVEKGVFSFPVSPTRRFFCCRSFHRPAASRLRCLAALFVCVCVC